jgi:hypothetical protein
MILNFDDEQGARHFEFCFVGFVLGGSLQTTKGMNVLRTEVGLFEKLESISELKPCGKKMVNGEPERQLKADDRARQVQITPQEFDLLYNYLAQTPWQSGSPARHAVETIDWLARVSRG